ncbi:MAG: TatD family hydrolase, partial [Candidatus Saccharimonadales bacterium]
MAIELFDTHCHIQSAGRDGGEPSTRALWAKSESSIDEIILRAQNKGVSRMLCVGCDLADSRLAIDCVRGRGNVYASIGIHPHEAAVALQNGHLDAFAALAVSPKVVAVGETGLDYFYNHSPKEAQIEVLKFQLDLASKHNLPLIFHVRDALDDFWPIFDSYPGLRGVLHSFTDTQVHLQQAIERKLYIGVNGIATFSKQSEQLEMYRTIPLENLLLETDAPFLTPAPYRGTICEPYHVRTTADFLSQLRGDNVEALAKATTW